MKRISSIKNRSDGFAVVEAVIIVVVIAVIVGVGAYFVTKDKKTANLDQSTSQAINSDDPDKLVSETTRIDTEVDNASDKQDDQDARSEDDIANNAERLVNESDF